MGDGNQWKEAERLLPDNCKVETEERAAVLEFDAGMERDEAERRALAEVCDRRADRE